MKQIIVGSSAAQYHNLLKRIPKDTDVWTSEPIEKSKGLDIKLIPESILSLVEQENGYACPDSLFTIKCSHLVTH